MHNSSSAENLACTQAIGIPDKLFACQLDITAPKFAKTRM